MLRNNARFYHLPFHEINLIQILTQIQIQIQVKENFQLKVNICKSKRKIFFDFKIIIEPR